MLEDTKQSTARCNIVILLTTLVVLRSVVNNRPNPAPVVALCATFAEILLVGLLWFFCPHGRQRTKMEWLLLVYAGWGILTRFLLQDLELIYSVRLEVLMLFEICAAFFVMHDADHKTASKIFTIITAILCAILTVWSVCGLVVSLTNVEKITLPLVTVEIHPVEKCLSISPHNRNETAVWFMIGLWLLAYQWTVCKRKLWRIPMAVSMLLMYIAIALQRSRTVWIAFAVAVGLLAASWLLALPWKSLPKYLFMAATAVAYAFLAYKSFSVVNDVFSAIHKAPSLDGYLENRKTVASRSRIWMAEIRFLMENPKALLFGQPRGAIVENMYRFYNGREKSIPHLHNGFMQVVAMYGLPGLVLLCSFLFALARKALRVYFTKEMAPERILTLLLIGIVFDGLMEPVFTAWVGLSTAVFMLAAGWMTRACAERSTNGQA